MDDKDFEMYIGWDDFMNEWNNQQPTDTQGLADAQQALENMGDTAWTEAPAETPAEPTPEAQPEAPAEPAPEEAPAEPAPEAETTWEASMDELMKMIDSLNTASDQWADVNAEIKQAAEDIKTAAPASDDVLQWKIDDLIQRLADKEANEIKMQKTIDVLKSEYEKTLNDKISLEFWTASDSRIAQIVNEDPDVKALIAAKMATGTDAESKVMDAWRTWRENVSGSNISDLVWNKKEAEVDALSAMGGEDTSNELNGELEDDMYL